MTKMIILTCASLWAATVFAKGKVAESPGGRFQLVQLGEMRRDQFLLDAETGRIWRASCIQRGSGTDCLEYAWVPEAIVDLNVSHDRFEEYVKKQVQSKKIPKPEPTGVPFSEIE